MRLSPSSLDKTADNADTHLRRRKYTQSPPAVFGKNAESPVLRTCSTLSHFVPSLPAAALWSLGYQIHPRSNAKAAAGAARERK